MKNVTIVIACLLLSASEIYAQHTLVQKWKTTDSIPVPESVLPVPGKNTLYVSLIDGKGNEKDGKGGVGIINKDGTVKDLNWITGLNAPKGLGLYKNKLYAADLTDVVVIDTKAGKIIKTIPIPGAVFLNDITTDSKGTVYVSDTRLGRIYRIVNDQPELYFEAAPGANGLKAIGSDLYVLAAKDLWVLDKNKNKKIIATGFQTGGDGLEPVGNGDFLVTCWAGIIYYVHANGQFEKLLDTQGKMNTADLTYDVQTKTLYVPTFNACSVVAYELN
ncbi:SMP-30/gluconolactonase/LRE family protein [Niabella soli]|uniref:ATP-binding protein n=1 Tax=Niabella soli DSM 19437 TaxID=929713 RepID=W0EW50_9BACT|nr:ATP-binding protein [Niabella soli]AHF15022.1 ATP-binding protein [Niabella soli DSM 19437]